jgi:DNA-binding response OmpR family regulator
MKSRRKAMKSLVGEKVVKISDYRAMRNGRSSRRLAVVTDKKELAEGLTEELRSKAEVLVFDSRFALEQALKGGEWDGVVLDERVLRDEASSLCEKIKKNSKLEDVFVVILSELTDKEVVRIGYEKGCDEWITKAQDVTHLARLLSHHLNG